MRIGRPDQRLRLGRSHLLEERTAQQRLRGQLFVAQAGNSTIGWLGPVDFPFARLPRSFAWQIPKLLSVTTAQRLWKIRHGALTEWPVKGNSMKRAIGTIAAAGFLLTPLLVSSAEIYRKIQLLAGKETGSGSAIRISALTLVRRQGAGQLATKKHGREHTGDSFGRHVIRADRKSDILKYLENYKGISAKTLFPDFVGLQRYLRWEFESLRTQLI